MQSRNPTWRIRTSYNSQSIELHLQLAVTAVGGQYSVAAPPDDMLGGVNAPSATAGPLCMDDYGLIGSSLIDLLARSGLKAPRTLMTDLEKGLLTDVWPGYLHLTCGAFILPVDGSLGTTGSIIPESAAITQLQQAFRRAARDFASSLQQPLTLTVTSVSEQHNPARYRKERGAFYVMNVTFDQPELADAIQQLLRQVSRDTGLPVSKMLSKGGSHITIRKYGDQHSMRGYSSRPADAIAMLNPVLAAKPLKLTCDILQLVLPSKGSKGLVFSTHGLITALINGSLGTVTGAEVVADQSAGIAGDHGKVCYRRAQPLWWQTTCRFHQLNAALLANLQLLGKSSTLAAAALTAEHDGVSTSRSSADRTHTIIEE